jgi:hypothetical protein
MASQAPKSLLAYSDTALHSMGVILSVVDGAH